MKTIKKPYYVRVTKETIDILSKWRWGNDTEHRLTIDNIVGMVLDKDYSRCEKGHNPANSIEGETFTFGKQISFEEFCRRENISYKKSNKLIIW